MYWNKIELQVNLICNLFTSIYTRTLSLNPTKKLRIVKFFTKRCLKLFSVAKNLDGRGFSKIYKRTSD
jgi:hypothetical protein